MTEDIVTRKASPTIALFPEASFGAALGSLVVIGLISPFLELASPIHGIIGLIILLVGMQIAWKTTAGKSVEILGPFTA